jgi:putative sigma-54 modulation protein
MRIDVKGRNVAVGDELRERIEKRFSKIARQVPDGALLEVELVEEHPERMQNSQIAEAALHLKGVTLRAREASAGMPQSINMAADDLQRQVKRYREKRGGRRQAAAAKVQPGPSEQPAAP